MIAILTFNGLIPLSLFTVTWSIFVRWKHRVSVFKPFNLVSSYMPKLLKTTKLSWIYQNNLASYGHKDLFFKLKENDF